MEDRKAHEEAEEEVRESHPRDVEEGRKDEDDDNDEKVENEEEKIAMIEDAFRDTAVPSWQNQITIRAMVTSFVLSIVFNFIVCKLNLTTGVIPSLNIAAGLLGFAILKGYTSILKKFGLLKQPFTRQENTVIQTCIVASSGIAFSSGTATYLLAMSPQIAEQTGGGNTPANVKTLSLDWIFAFLFCVSFVGLFSIMPLRKMMILRYKLTYPSGTATAFLINSFHTPTGAKLAKKQVRMLFKSFSFSFLFAAFQWFFIAGDKCGFRNFPTFGLEAFKQKFYFDFSSTYVGVGMICPFIINISLLLGAIVSWGIMWPLIEGKEGDWYQAGLPESSLHGLQGYKVFVAIAMMLGDGIYHVVFMLITTSLSLAEQYRTGKKTDSDTLDIDNDLVSYDDQRRLEFFLKDQIPNWAAFTGYAVLALIATIAVPFIFHQLKWYHVLVAFLVAPVMAFCNAYGCGLTDWSLASNYGKICIIIFSAWVGLKDGGIIAGLAACGVMMSTVSTASDLMQDFKTGYLTLSSPRSMFFSQVLGTFMGCILSPSIFWVFYSAYPVGDPNGTYPAPYGLLFRGMALLGVEGLSALPKNCLTVAASFFAFAIVLNMFRQALQHFETHYKMYRFIPNPMCMAIPFYLGGYFAIDMCVGSLIHFIWIKMNQTTAAQFVPALASGLICGDSLWGIPAAVLSLFNIKAPMCMRFLSAATNVKVDAFLEKKN